MKPDACVPCPQCLDLSTGILGMKDILYVQEHSYSPEVKIGRHQAQQLCKEPRDHGKAKGENIPLIHMGGYVLGPQRESQEPSMARMHQYINRDIL